MNAQNDIERQTKSTWVRNFFADNATLKDLVKYLQNRIQPYSSKAEYTKNTQAMIQAEIEVMDLVLGDLDVTLMKIFVIHSKIVTNNAIRPGMTSCGITQLICKV